MRRERPYKVKAVQGKGVCTAETRAIQYSEPVFVNLLRVPRIYSQPGGIDSSESIPGRLKRLHILAQDSKETANCLLIKIIAKGEITNYKISRIYFRFTCIDS